MLIVTTDVLAGHDIRTVYGQVFGVATSAVQPATGPSSSATFRVTGENPTGLGQARRDAVARLGEEAARMGANAVIGMCFDTIALDPQRHEVCAYGTAVVAVPAQQQPGQPVHPGRPADPAVPQQFPPPPHQAAQAQLHPQPGYEAAPGRPPMVARNLTISQPRDDRR